MATVAKTSGRGTTTRRYVIGRAQFAAISAVEGLKLTPASEKRLKETEGLSPQQRRGPIVAAYKKARGR
jgi:hypothetical protein